MGTGMGYTSSSMHVRFFANEALPKLTR